MRWNCDVIVISTYWVSESGLCGREVSWCVALGMRGWGGRGRWRGTLSSVTEHGVHNAGCRRNGRRTVSCRFYVSSFLISWVWYDRNVHDGIPAWHDMACYRWISRAGCCSSAEPKSFEGRTQGVYPSREETLKRCIKTWNAVIKNVWLMEWLAWMIRKYTRMEMETGSHQLWRCWCGGGGCVVRELCLDTIFDRQDLIVLPEIVPHIFHPRGWMIGGWLDLRGLIGLAESCTLKLRLLWILG